MTVTIVMSTIICTLAVPFECEMAETILEVKNRPVATVCEELLKDVEESVKASGEKRLYLKEFRCREQTT